MSELDISIRKRKRKSIEHVTILWVFDVGKKEFRKRREEGKNKNKRIESHDPRERMKRKGLNQSIQREG